VRGSTSGLTDEAAAKANRAHPDRASFFYEYGAGVPWIGE